MDKMTPNSRSQASGRLLSMAPLGSSSCTIAVFRNTGMETRYHTVPCPCRMVYPCRAPTFEVAKDGFPMTLVKKKDPSVTYLNKLGYNVVKLPRTGIEPMDVIGRDH